METLQRQRLPLLDIDEVERPLTEDDKACLKEVAAILQKHNRLDRFGVNLLHEHFHVADDEVLMETCDFETRVLTIRPVKVANDMDQTSIATNWRLDTDGAVVSMTCRTRCPLKDDRKTHAGAVHDYSR